MGYCGWASSDPLDRVYHDTEWGIPVHDDRHMPYEDFLIERRKLMAAKIKAAFEQLKKNVE